MTAKEKIAAWRAEHPDGTQVDCINAGVASQATVYRLWPSDDPKRSRKGTPKQRRDKTVETEARTERMTAFVTQENKKRLKHMCVDDDITTSDWLNDAIENAWKNRKN